RARGCLFPDCNCATHQVNVKRWIELGNATITVDEMPPLDPFQAEKKSAAQLLLFDTKAGAFQRVKVSGQVVHGDAGTYYMMDGTNGLRFQPKAAAQFQSGDQVEVVGLVELGGPSPVLREAVARKTGRTALPHARKLMPSELINEYDSTLVRLEGVLLELREGRAGQVLEIQSGL